MNVANLQIEGLVMALAAVNRMLVAKGVASVSEIDDALHRAEAALVSDERLAEDMSPANRDAVCFPVRMLRLANEYAQGDLPGFSDLARGVGQTKQRYNDQM